MALDINTSAWRKGLNSLYPSSEIIESAYQIGIPVALGSDAHHPDDVGSGFDHVLKILKSIGYKGSCSYKDRVRTLILFDQEDVSDEHP